MCAKWLSKSQHPNNIYYSHLNRIIWRVLRSYKYLNTNKTEQASAPGPDTPAIPLPFLPFKIFIFMPLIQNMQICVRLCHSHTSFCSRLSLRSATCHTGDSSRNRFVPKTRAVTRIVYMLPLLFAENSSTRPNDTHNIPVNHRWIFIGSVDVVLVVVGTWFAYAVTCHAY